jgi:phosphoglucosamine mutase
MKLVVDCAHGAAYNIAPSVFEELGAEVISIGAEPDGLNINEECGATKPEMLRDSVLENQADAGIALDGDGDRLIMIDRRGNVVDGDEALFIIARARRDRINGGVVGTQMSNFGLELAIRELGLDFHRSKVGDRYVMEMLQEKNLKLGGESSGHIINLDLATTGDGIISALQILEEMSRSGRSLYDLKQPMSKYPQRLNNIRLENRVDLGGHPEIDVLVREAMAALAGRGRVLLRPSGTEPLIRVMVEGENLEQVEDLALRLTHGVEQILRNQR